MIRSANAIKRSANIGESSTSLKAPALRLSSTQSAPTEVAIDILDHEPSRRADEFALPSF
jgi:hypothetical protein